MTQDEFNKLTSFSPLAKDFNPMAVNPWHLLYNTKTKRPWLCTAIYGTVNGMAKRIPRAEPWYVMGSRINSYGKLPFNKDFKTSRCWEYVWNPVTRELEYQPEGLTLEEKYDHMLTVHKAAALDRITGVVNSYRRPFQKNLLDQEYVHQWKFEEASLIVNLPLDSVIVEEEYGFVADYAKSLDVDIRVAAQEIVDKQKFQRDAYRESESLRIQYCDAVYKEQTFEGVSALCAELNMQHKGFFRS